MFQIPWLVAALGLFLIIYAVGFFKLFQHWKLRDRAEAASCCMSIIHGTPAAVMAASCLLKSPWEFSGQNTPLQDGIMEFSIAYFIMDLLHYMFFFPGDLIFIGHHLAVLFVMISCHYFVGHGGFAVMSLLCVAEITSGCQNAWTLARAAKRNSPNVAMVYEVLSPIFYTFYSCVRGLVAPLLTYHLARFFISGKADDVIPRWLGYCWMGIVSLAIIASIGWILNLWIELFRGYAAMPAKKHNAKTK